MGTIKAQEITNDAGTILLDKIQERWPDTELLRWLNDGQRETVNLNPFANPVTEAVRLVGGTKQDMSELAGETDNSGTSIDRALHVIGVVRNMGTDGSTVGRAISRMEMATLDARRPDWHTDTADSQVKHWVYDPLNPRVFYVTPPQPDTGTGYVELAYSASPDDVDLGQAIVLNDIYRNALLDYVLYRAYSKDADFGSADLATNHRQAYQRYVESQRAQDAAMMRV